MKYDCLIIDDDELLSKRTCGYFNTSEIKTAWVADAKSCIDFFRDNKADLVLLEATLGNTSGFDLCRYLRETTNIPVLFISARTSEDDILSAFDAGGDDYIQKPFSISVLLAKVKVLLKRYGEKVTSAGGEDN